MIRPAVLAAALAIVPATAEANPLLDIFRYDADPPPVAGSCPAIAAAVGPSATWYGVFSGKRYDELNDNHFPFAARGCFESELACTIWQQRAITHAQGPIHYTSCRQGVSPELLR